MTEEKDRTYSHRGDDYLLEAQRVCGEDKRGQDKPTPRCPYCGHKMVHQYVYGDHFFRCPKCRAVAPDKDTEAKAYEAAMQRWQEPNRMLTLEEVKEQRAVWLEENIGAPRPTIFYANGYLHHSVFMGGFGDSDDVDSNVWYDDEDYGVDWRCWLRKPTQEERERTPWGGGQHEKD